MSLDAFFRGIARYLKHTDKQEEMTRVWADISGSEDCPDKQKGAGL
jgi:hypothetical protein